MRYISYYSEYPIYEPAEGGYYYAGNKLIKSEKMSKRQCRKEFERIWQECEKENIENGFTDEVDWNLIIQNHGIYPWIRENDNCIFKHGMYIGTGESYIIERKRGSETSGYEPYC